MKKLEKKFIKEDAKKRLEQEKKVAAMGKKMEKEEALVKKKIIQKRKKSLEKTPKKTKKGGKPPTKPKPQKVILQGSTIERDDPTIKKLRDIKSEEFNSTKPFHVFRRRSQRKTPLPRDTPTKEETSTP